MDFRSQSLKGVGIGNAVEIGLGRITGEPCEAVPDRIWLYNLRWVNIGGINLRHELSLRIRPITASIEEFGSRDI